MNDDTHLVVETPQLVVTHDPDECVTEVTVRGRWDDALRTRMSQLLRACAAKTPRALFVDLSALVDPAGASASTWRAAARYTQTQRHATKLILCGTPPRALHRLRAPALGNAVLVETVAAAHAAAQSPPHLPYRRTMVLSPRDNAASAGRTMAGDACLAWNLAHLTYPARAIMSELLTNAVEHAGTDMVASVSLRGDVLHLAVQDEQASLPRLIETSAYLPGEAVEQRGAGLRLVRATANAWGALPCGVGKVVWATLAREAVR